MDIYSKKIEEIMAELGKIRALATNEKRELTEDEKVRCVHLISVLEGAEYAGSLPANSTERTQISNPDNQVVDVDGKSVRVLGQNDSKDYRAMFGNGGLQWDDKDGKFFQSLFSGRMSPALQRAMVEGTPSDGGFLVPEQYARQIHAVSLENELVMPMGATVIPMTSDTLKIPAFDIGDHSSNLFGGFTASYTAEAGTISDASPKTRQMELQAQKLTGLIRMSNELAQDAIGGDAAITRLCGQGLAWYRDKSWLKGSGAGEPLGILNSGCLIAVAKEAGQAASTIVYENLTKMVAQLFSGSFGKSVWICHQSTIPQLLTLSLSVGTGGSAVPVLNESNGKFTMLTRPVYFTEKTEALGAQGDILLADFSQYVIGMRRGMRIDTSQHLYFASDELAARLIERHDGQPLWHEALTLEDGSTTVSPFVTLAVRD